MVMRNTLQNLCGGLDWVALDASRVSSTLSKHLWLSGWGGLKMLDSVLRGVAQVVFVNNPISGLLILIGLFLADLTTGYATVYCTVIAFIVAKVFLDLPDSQVCGGLPLFSAVLVGSVTGSLYTPFFHAPLTPVIWAYMGLGAVFSVCVCSGLGSLLSLHGLPAYTLPFNIATSIIFLGMRGAGYGAQPTHHTPNTFDNITIDGMSNESVHVEWEKVCLGVLLSAGQVWAVESVVCSVLVGVGMMLCSPLLTAACFLGGMLGTLTALVVSKPPFTLVYAGVWGYNGFLAGGAMVFFLIASPRVFLLAVINSLLATFIQAALLPVFEPNRLPVFTFPFCLASLLLLAAASSSSFHHVTSPSFPEKHLILHRQEFARVQKQGRREGDSNADRV